jgi:hypothetical protein
MRAQVSLEYLLISVVAIALLTVSAASLSQIKTYAEESSRLLEFQSSAKSLGDAIYSVCMLGSGNRREVFLRTTLDVNWENGVVQISDESSMARAVPCEVSSQKGIEGSVIVKNENGKVKIRGY